MKFSKAQAKEQKAINDYFLSEWNDALSYYNDYDRLYLPKWKKFRNCHVEICITPPYIYLKSYNTIVAVFDKFNNHLYDALRFEYGYSATSVQHIAKFKKHISNILHLPLEYIKTYRYYDI